MALFENVNFSDVPAIRCTDCGGRGFLSDKPSQWLRHSSKCSVSPRKTTPTRPGATAEILNARGEEQPVSRPAVGSIQRAARDGRISEVLSEDEIVKAVRSGLVTGSDALNRDS